MIRIRELPHLALLPLLGGVADFFGNGISKHEWSGTVLMYCVLMAAPLWLFLKGVQFVLIKANTPMDQK